MKKIGKRCFAKSKIGKIEMVKIIVLTVKTFPLHSRFKTSEYKATSSFSPLRGKASLKTEQRKLLLVIVLDSLVGSTFAFA